MADVTLTTEIKGTDKAQGGIEGVTKKIDNLGKKAESVGKSLSIGLTAPLLAVGGAAAKMAIEVVESENLFTVAMGDMAKAGTDWSKQLRKDLGLNEFELRKSVATFNAMFDAMGLSEEAAYGMSTGLTELSHDMASFFNLKPEEAFQKLQAGITGETEPLKRLGILINETTIKTTALTHGIIKQGEELTEQQKVHARYIAIMEQTTNAQGDLARTLDSPANQLRIMRDEAAQLTTELGMALIPVVGQLIGVGNSLLEMVQAGVKWFQALSPEMQDTAIKIGLAAAAAGPLLVVFGKLVSVGSSLVSGLALLATPIGLVTAAVAGLVTAGVLLYKNWEDVEYYAGTAWGAIKTAVLSAVDKMLSGLNGLLGFIPAWGDQINSARGNISALIDDEMVAQTRRNVQREKRIATEAAKSTNQIITAEMHRTQAEINKLNAERIALSKNEAIEATKARREEAFEAEMSIQSQIDDIKSLEGVSRETKANLLKIWKEHYEEMGEASKDGVKVINGEIASLRTSGETESEKFSKAWEDEFTVNMPDHVLTGVRDMKGHFTTFFADNIKGTKSFGDTIKDLWTGIANSIIDQIARITASQAFSSVFGGAGVATGAGVAAGGGVGAGGAALGSTTTVAGATAATAAGLGTGVAVLTAGYLLIKMGERLSGLEGRRDARKKLGKMILEINVLRVEYAKVLNELSKEEIDDFNKLVDDYYRQANRLHSKYGELKPYTQEGVTINGVPTPEKLAYGTFAKQQTYFRSLDTAGQLTYQAQIDAATKEYNFLRSQWQQLSLGNQTELSPEKLQQRLETFQSNLPKFFIRPGAQLPSFQQFYGGGLNTPVVPQYETGGSFIASMPRLFVAGENGAERVTVEPAGTFGKGRGGGNIVFNGPVIMDDIAARKFAKLQSSHQRRESSRYA